MIIGCKILNYIWGGGEDPLICSCGWESGKDYRTPGDWLVFYFWIKDMDSTTFEYKNRLFCCGMDEAFS